jgi:hypothetical protein
MALRLLGNVFEIIRELQPLSFHSQVKFLFLMFGGFARRS